jgi:hypothetical protein
MQKIIETLAASVAANAITAESKVEFSRRFAVSKRTCDSWITRGMPHLKLSPRMVRIPPAEAGAWVKENYFTQRRTQQQEAKN